LRPGSAAWQSGLREGDLILEVNGRAVNQLEELRAVLRAAGGLYRVEVLRDGQLILLARR
jgi:S1-C subfamily serine protease